MERGELRCWGKLPNFCLSNVNAETGKETKEVTFLTFLRQGPHHWNNEEFGEIRSRAHTSCRLSSKCIFWLNFLCTDLLLADTHYSSAQSVAGAVEEFPSVLSFPAHQRQLRTIWENTGQASLGVSVGQILSPCNYVGTHLLSQALFSHGERLPTLCLIMHTE